ncbi:uncharacterized protein TNCV_1201501 [Trichonephila clavipes]|nr:uncharacterized protein TNCV_1201501 [Trichonephila clavipes]
MVLYYHLNIMVELVFVRMVEKSVGYGHELVAGVSWARILLPLKTRRVDEAIPPTDVVVRKEGCQLRCPPRHSTKVFKITSLHAEIVEVEIEVVSPSIVPSGNFAELNRTVTCMVLKANDRRTSCPCHDEFRGPRSDYVRQLLKRKDDEIEKLKCQLLNTFKQNKTLKDTNTTLLSEVTQLNKVVSNLHNSISRLQNIEGERKALLIERENLKNHLDEQEKAQLKEIEKLKKELERINSTYKEDIKNELLQSECKAQLTLESYLNKIRDKENHVVLLQEKVTELKNEKDQEVLKIQIECEEKINKLKSQLSKSRRIHQFQGGFKKDDIFRQKYIQIEKESKEEILRLKKEIEELHSENAILKNTDKSLNKPKIAILNGAKNENGNPSVYKREFEYNKRIRADEDIDETNLSVLKSTNSSSSKLIRPAKKKLFNLDHNYFGK